MNDENIISNKNKVFLSGFIFICAMKSNQNKGK